VNTNTPLWDGAAKRVNDSPAAGLAKSSSIAIRDGLMGEQH
jgi:hypothetical protein